MCDLGYKFTSKKVLIVVQSSSTREVLVSTLHEIGYTTLELLLTPLQFGVPNSRLRYYLLAKKHPLSWHAVPDDEPKGQVFRHIPVVEVISTTPAIQEYLDTRTDSNLLVPDRVLGKWGRLFDIVTPSSRRTCCFTRGMSYVYFSISSDKFEWNTGYTQLVERAGSILQENENLDVCQLEYFPSLLFMLLSRPLPHSIRFLKPSLAVNVMQRQSYIL